MGETLLGAIVRAVRIGPVEAMRQDECAAGHRVVKPGDVPWLSVSDWPDDITVSVTNKQEVRIVAIRARGPGFGAFSRLIAAIKVHGLTPVVVEPLTHMTDILKRWGWQSTSVGSGFTAEEQWRPPSTTRTVSDQEG